MATQSVEDFVVRIDPESRLNQHLDYFGTTVIEFGISRPHEHMAIDVRARVRTTAPEEPPESSWEAVEERAYDAAAGEFLLPVGPEPDDVVLDDLVGLTRGETPLATLRQLVDVIPDRFEYRAGVTYVGSTVQDLLDAGAGVCQDFAHLALLLLQAPRDRRALRQRLPVGAVGTATRRSAEVETHAWVEALLPTASGLTWVAADPTNRSLGGESHVKIGHGRHYADVPPIKGVYRGSADSELSASVRMTRRTRTKSAPEPLGSTRCSRRVRSRWSGAGARSSPAWTSSSPRARWCTWPARTAAARRRCCACWPGWPTRAPAASSRRQLRVRAREGRACRRGAGRRVAGRDAPAAREGAGRLGGRDRGVGA